MRILWLHQYFATPKGWGSLRQYEFAKRWAEAGHTVDVVCTPAYDATLGERGALRRLEADGVTLHVCGAAYRPQMGFARRVCSFLHFMVYALGYLIRHRAEHDVMIVSSGPLTNLIPALWGKWVQRLPFAFEVLDVWPDAAIEAGVLKNRVLRALSSRLEAAGYRYASRIVTCSTGMSARVYAKLQGARGSTLVDSEPYRDYLSGKVRPFAKIVTIAHGSTPVAPSECARLRKRLCQANGWAEDVCIVLYMGAMGLSNAMDDLVVAMRETRDAKSLVWLFAGGGKEEGKVRRQLSQSRGVFLGKVSHAEMVETCAAADVNVVTFMHAPLFFENSPNKFFDGIAAGLPAVFNRTTWLEPWLKAYGCGIVCTGEEAGAEMARQLRLLAADADRRRAMGAGARRLAEEVFSRDRLAAEYLEILREIAR
jgi:glycosyltransferase involved in cell wall biosynthesis